MVRVNRLKGDRLQLAKAENETRGRKRKLSVSTAKVVKRELKKRRATPKKVAKKLSDVKDSGGDDLVISGLEVIYKNSDSRLYSLTTCP